MVSEVMYADDLVLMSETIVELRNKLMKWKEAFESKGEIFNLMETKVIASRSIIKDGSLTVKFTHVGCAA